MKRITIITGERNTGKTFLAKSISLLFNNPVYIDFNNIGYDYEEEFAFSKITKKTDLIVIDNIYIPLLQYLWNKFSESQIEIKQNCEKTFTMDTPNVILITKGAVKSFIKDPSFIRRTDVILTEVIKNFNRCKYFNFKKI